MMFERYAAMSPHDGLALRPNRSTFPSSAAQAGSTTTVWTRSTTSSGRVSTCLRGGALRAAHARRPDSSGTRQALRCQSCRHCSLGERQPSASNEKPRAVRRSPCSAEAGRGGNPCSIPFTAACSSRPAFSNSALVTSRLICAFFLYCGRRRRLIVGFVRLEFL
jgi:hypothetical protein